MLGAVAVPPPAPIGVVLAGGAGARLGGSKATALLGGRSLARWVAAALGAVLDDVVIAARADTELPSLGLAVWREPVDGPRHPLAGIASALVHADGRDVLVCAVDLPFVGTETLRALVEAPGEVAVADGQPLLGRYGAGVGPALAAAADAGTPVRRIVASLGATVVPVADPSRTLWNVNTASDLARAEAMLGESGG
jgi:molybdopterin-guanine dinucleotide biosynthesis protein A